MQTEVWYLFQLFFVCCFVKQQQFMYSLEYIILLGRLACNRLS